MKTRIFITLLFLLCGYSTKAQILSLSNNRDINSRDSVDRCVLRVVYRYDFPLDTISSKRYTDIKHLDIGTRYTHYYSQLAELSDSIMYKARLDRSRKEGGINTTGFLKENESPEHEDFYTHYPDRQKLTVWTRFTNTEYIYSEPVPQFDWRITGERDTVLGYNCMKAITSFRGRDYDVWFTLEIPMSFGPWKFSGLPGLILKAEEVGGNFTWTAIGLERPYDTNIYVYNTTGEKNMPTISPIKTVTTTRANVEKLKRKRWEDPIGLLLSADTKSVPLTIMQGGVVINRKAVQSGELQFDYVPPLELE